jgi:DNA-binding response OmpR family regulator
MKRRILLVDDEVAVLLTLKAVLEISGFDVDTAASAREGKNKLRNHEYHMVITDMRMENDASGAEVIQAARTASYHPAVALLTAFPIADEDWQSLGADKMLVKPMHTQVLLQQIEKLLAAHEAKLRIWSTPAPKRPNTGTGAAAADGAQNKPAASRPTKASASSRLKAKAKPLAKTRKKPVGKTARTRRSA